MTGHLSSKERANYLQDKITCMKERQKRWPWIIKKKEQGREKNFQTIDELPWERLKKLCVPYKTPKIRFGAGKLYTLV